MVLIRLISLCAFVFPLGLYFFTSVPTTYWEDTAAFQTAAYELGIVHNPSFPLYVLIGKVATLIPFADPRLLVNLVSALFAALSIWVLYQIAVISLSARLTRSGKLLPRLIAFVAALAVAGLYGFWIQAVRAEVYSFNALILLLLIWLVFKYRFNEIDLTRFVMMFGFLAGLGLANHSLIFLAALVPIAIIVGINDYYRLFNVGSITVAGMFFLLALGVFLYLPIRELFAPVFNWGDFSSLDAFIDSVLRLDDRTAVELVGSSTPFVDRLLSIIGSLTSPLGIAVMLLALAGIAYFWKYDSFLTFILTCVLLCNLIVTGYAAEFSAYNLDLYGYLIPTYALLALFGSIGLGGLVTWVARRFRLQQTGFRVGLIVAALITLAIVGLNFESTFASASKRYVCIAEDFAGTALTDLPKDAIFLAGEDNSFAPLLCQQVVAGVRSDVIVLSGGALLRHDYRRKVQERYPKLKYPDNWLESTFELSFRDNLTSWIGQNDNAHPVYLTLSEWTSQLIKDLRPDGVAYSYEPGYSFDSKDSDSSRSALLHFADLSQQFNDLTSREHFGRMLYNHGVYLVGHQQVASATRVCRDAARLDPTNVDLLVNCLKMFTAAGSAKDQNWITDMIFAVDPENEDVMKILETSLALREEANR